MDSPDAFYPVPLSGYPAIEWPAIPTGLRATMLALESQFRDTQWWPKRVIREHQFTQLAHLVRHAHKTAPFYKNRLDVLLGVKKLNDDVWQQIPILTRSELQAQGEKMVSSALPKQHGETSQQKSSGSTGRPVSVTVSNLEGVFFAALNLRHYRWHNLDFSGSFGAIRPVRPKELEHARLNKPIAWVPGHQSGPMYLFDVTLPVSQQVDWLLQQSPTYLLTMPSNLMGILDHMEEAGITLPSIDKVLTLSEIISPELRLRCREVLGVPLIDSYSAVEVGMVALQCPEHDHYHIQSESLLVEIIDEQGNPCKEGEVGRVVISDLHNFAMPMIRYDIGDYAEVGPSCACGRGLPVLSRILGRTRNMVTYPSGDKAWALPWFASELMAIAPVNQIQLIQHTCDNIEIKLVSARTLTPAEETEIVALFQTRMHHPFTFQFNYVDIIERSKGGKFEDFISMI